MAMQPKPAGSVAVGSNIATGFDVKLDNERALQMSKKPFQYMDQTQAAAQSVNASPTEYSKAQQIAEAMTSMRKRMPVDYNRSQLHGLAEQIDGFKRAAMWHAALVTAMEFIDAQIKMDIFSGNEKAAEMYKIIVYGGLQKLVMENDK